MHRKTGIWSTGKRISPISSDDGGVGDFFVDKFAKNINNCIIKINEKTFYGTGGGVKLKKYCAVLTKTRQKNVSLFTNIKLCTKIN